MYNFLVDIQQLKFFITTAKYEHLSHAAEELNISQSSLSYSISKLESELGVKLFDRIGRNIELNNAGSDFLEYAQDILQKANEAQKVLNAKYGQNYRHVVIQSVPISYHDKLLDKLYSIEPKIELAPISADTPAVLADKLHQMETDICYSPFNLDPQGLNCYEFQPEEIVVLISSKHPLKDKDSITVDELKQQQFISGSTAIASIFLDIISAACGFEADISCRTASHDETINMLKKMPYVYLASQSVYSHMQDVFDCTDIHTLRINSPHRYYQRKLYWRQKNNAPTVKKLCDAIIKAFA